MSEDKDQADVVVDNEATGENETAPDATSEETDSAEAVEASEAGDTTDAPAEATEAPAPVEATEEAAKPKSVTRDDGVFGDDEPLVTEGMDWFVLRVASNKEDSVRETLLRKIKIEGFEHLVNRILVPTEKVKTVKGGKQKILLKKLYPGYVFVEMRLEADGRIPQDVFFLIKETTGVGDFIGTAGHPTPMPLNEVEKILEASKAPDEQEATIKTEFQKGDHVKIKEGPFENTEASVDEVLAEQGKVRVIATVFGRPVPIELEAWLIERMEE